MVENGEAHRLVDRRFQRSLFRAGIFQNGTNQIGHRRAALALVFRRNVASPGGEFRESEVNKATNLAVHVWSGERLVAKRRESEREGKRTTIQSFRSGEDSITGNDERRDGVCLRVHCVCLSRCGDAGKSGPQLNMAWQTCITN